MSCRSGVALVVLSLATASHVHAADLGSDTLSAFDRYVRITESRMDADLHGTGPFLWIDRLPDASDRNEAYRRLRMGDVVVSRLATLDGKQQIDVPHGLIHHWIGTTFIPKASVDRVIALMQGYDRYDQLYAPNVRRSRTIRQQGDRYTVYLQLFMKKVIGVVLNTDNDVRYSRLSPVRAHVRSYSTRITEVQENATGPGGEKGDVELPAGHDSGFLWRFNNYCSVEGRSEGAYVQCESVSLSRGIPAGLGWIVGPFVTSIPRESLEFTLGHMRSALAAGL
jgi:hypothetical protein